MGGSEGIWGVSGAFPQLSSTPPHPQALTSATRGRSCSSATLTSASTWSHGVRPYINTIGGVWDLRIRWGGWVSCETLQ